MPSSGNSQTHTAKTTGAQVSETPRELAVPVDVGDDAGRGRVIHLLQNEGDGWVLSSAIHQYENAATSKAAGVPVAAEVADLAVEATAHVLAASIGPRACH